MAKSSGKGIVRIGDHVELVQWKSTPDGYAPVTVAGEYLGSTPDQWQLADGETVTRYSRDEWMLCLR